MPSLRVSWQICENLRAALLDKEEPRLGARREALSSSHATKLSKQATNASINTSNTTTSSYRSTLTTPRSRANGQAPKSAGTLTTVSVPPTAPRPLATSLPHP